MNIDFEYDGLYLSDFGCVICNFDTESLEIASIGSVITFNKTPMLYGKYYLTAGTSYEECLEAEINICKNPCYATENGLIFSSDEQRYITRWLNRREFLKLSFPDDDDYVGIYFEASFNVDTVKSCGKVIGFKLHIMTNRPFAIAESVTKKINIISTNQKETINDISDEIGYVYADMEITCKGNGDLNITNSMDGRTTSIRNCKTNEVITIKNMIIETSDPAHSSTIMDDFNFNFLRISNKFRERTNRLTFSLPCSGYIKYTPIRKVGI